MNSTDFKREGRITNGACPLWTRIFKQSALNAWRITVMALNNTDILGFLNDPTKSFKQVRRRMYYFKESGYNNDHPPPLDVYKCQLPHQQGYGEDWKDRLCHT